TFSEIDGKFAITACRGTSDTGYLPSTNSQIISVKYWSTRIALVAASRRDHIQLHRVTTVVIVPPTIFVGRAREVAGRFGRIALCRLSGRLCDNLNKYLDPGKARCFADRRDRAGICAGCQGPLARCPQRFRPERCAQHRDAKRAFLEQKPLPH